VLHGASVEIGEDQIHWSEESIRDTVRSALAKCVALGVDVLFTPLLAAGVGRAPATVSARGILQAISEFGRSVELRGKEFQQLKIIVVVYQEAELARHEFEQQFNLVFGRGSVAGQGSETIRNLEKRGKARRLPKKVLATSRTSRDV
jgi:hypothetical protein